MLYMRWITLGLWLVWLLFYWRGGVKIVGDIQASPTRQDTFVLFGLTALTVLMVLTGVFLTLQSDVAPAGIEAAIGAVLAFIGVAGTFYCRRYLGRFWTAESAIQTDHQVIDTGPYGVVRHPIYTFALLLYVGTALSFSVWWQWVFVLGSVVLYLLKTAYEDAFLREQLADYADYRERVRYRLLPFIW